jgi:hypothetical protein
VLRVPVQAEGSAGKVEIIGDGATINATQRTTQALHGADGLLFDVQGNLYVCANQANEIQVLTLTLHYESFALRRRHQLQAVGPGRTAPRRSTATVAPRAKRFSLTFGSHHQK